jgi:hypothetical protein
MSKLITQPQGHLLTVVCVGLNLFLISGNINAKESYEALPETKNYSFTEAAVESITGDVYSDQAAANWQDLSYSNMFSKGWDKPWVSPPTGGGGAPRHGWINAYDGIFFRLSIATFGWQHGNGNDNYTGNLTSYTPLNQRLEIQTDIPIASGTGADGQTNFGDFRITPRILLSESKNTTQSLNLSFRTPTGNSINGNSVAAIAPQYNFWHNSWKGLVIRGGAGFTVPYAGELSKTGVRSSFDANLAVGYYFTPHDAAPIGDMVWYVSTNLSQPIDNRAATSNTFVSLTPGFRSHVGANWFLLGAVEVPVTNNPAYDYQVIGGIMKVY